MAAVTSVQVHTILALHLSLSLVPLSLHALPFTATTYHAVEPVLLYYQKHFTDDILVTGN